jgi:tetratricopeptide (TPR) repeat protein
MNRHNAMRQALHDTPASSADTLFRLGVQAVNAGLFEQVQDRFAAEVAGARANDARLWQVLGLARRGLQDSAAAHAAFARAAALAPADGSVLLGRAAAQHAEGQAAQARADLAEILRDNPGWLDGHICYARLTATVAPGDDIAHTVRAALKRFPRQADLWITLIRLHSEAGAYDQALTSVAQARAEAGTSPALTMLEGTALNEAGRPEQALAVFATLPANLAASARLHRIRALIRLHRFDEAVAVAEPHGADETDMWPYRALLWRLTGDPRWQWLEGDERLVSVHDLAGCIDLVQLGELLRSIHRGSGRPLDQSVRGGTQTDGNLLARAEPEIRALRAALLGAVEAHVAQLPAPAPGHPTLLATRSPVRVAGSWSVRLAGQGFHVDHVHQQGWLSSSFYVALPEGPQGIDRTDTDHNGWLALGECRALLPDVEGFRLIEPKPGRLVIFPSTMWHGSRTFAAGERLTVAFDIAPPAQEII